MKFRRITWLILGFGLLGFLLGELIISYKSLTGDSVTNTNITLVVGSFIYAALLKGYLEGTIERRDIILVAVFYHLLLMLARIGSLTFLGFWLNEGAVMLLNKTWWFHFLWPVAVYSIEYYLNFARTSRFDGPPGA